MAKALQIQGSYSAIGDITETYVSISDEYITPAIAKMEKLSLLPDDEWRVQSTEFTDWCKGAIDEIQSKAEKAGRNMEPNMTERVVRLHERMLDSAPAY